MPTAFGFTEFLFDISLGRIIKTIKNMFIAEIGATLVPILLGTLQLRLSPGIHRAVLLTVTI